jgi:membrane protease YdiL (CAAX protease family)
MSTQIIGRLGRHTGFRKFGGCKQTTPESLETIRRKTTMTPESIEIKVPMVWEANLLVASLLILVMIGGGIAGAFGISALLIVFQLLVILPGLIWIALRRYPLKPTLRLHSINRQTVIWSVLIGLVCWPIAAGMAALIEQGLSRIGPGPQIPYPTSAMESIVYAIVFIVLAPITEEPIFRGFVMSAWLRRGTLPGLLLSGFLFASLHLQIVAILPIALLGVVFGFLVQRSNSLYSSIIAHMCYNTIGTLFIIVPSLRDTSGWLLVAVGSLAIPLAFLLLRSFARQFPARQEMLPADHSHRIWVILSLLAVLVILGLSVLGELFLRLNPDTLGV